MVTRFESEANAYDYNEFGSSSSSYASCGSTAGTDSLDGGVDDSTCLNAWLDTATLTALAPGSVIYLHLPPARRASGWYDVCNVMGLTVPSLYGSTLFIFGGGKIRVTPECGTSNVPASGLVYVGQPSNTGYPDYNNTLLYLSDLTLDGSGLARFVLTLYHSNIMLHNMHVRNAAPVTSIFGSGAVSDTAASAPLYVEGGGQISIDGSNRFECVNEPGTTTPIYSSCITSTACKGSGPLLPGTSTVSMCTYDIWFQGGHDSKISDVVTIGAAVANIYDEKGDGNSWIHPQTYNSNNTVDPFQYFLYSYQGIWIDDRAHLLLNPYVGQANNYGIYVRHDTTPPKQNLLILGGDVIGEPTGGTFYTVGMDNGAFVDLSHFQFQASASQTCVNTSTVLGASSTFRDNTNCAYTSGTTSFGTISASGALTVAGTSTLSGPSTISSLTASGTTTITGSPTVLTALSSSGTTTHLCINGTGTLYLCK